MNWQDIVISFASILFSISLFIQIYYNFKEKTGPIKHWTSIPTCVGLYAITLSYWTLGLYFSTVISFISGTLWLILFLQRLIYDKTSTMLTQER